MSLEDPEEKRTARTRPVGLSRRLMAIADLARSGECVCDVGCDHAHIPIRLLQEGRFKRAIGMDVIEGPLEKAAGNLSLYGMQDRIGLRLSDGLDAFCIGEADTLVITGMGGMLIIKILSEAAELIERFDELILSPQSDIYAVRKYLSERCYAFIDEAEILEDGKFYTLMKVRLNRESVHSEEVYEHNEAPEQRPCTPANDAELTYGPCLLRKKDNTLKAYLSKRRIVLTEIKEKLIESGRNADDVRIHEIDEEVRIIDEAERYY
jgi:tRNA (adenine22-N1)-methyltransferase